tara:strand:- start:2348 stop:3067 length:720 start_codon:yes stop_codon:yes gene_type:complete
MPVKIHGKDYRTVAERVELFHKNHKNAEKSITTEILHNDESTVMMKTTVTVGDSTYTGHAVEVYNSSMINKTSALENCETSAIGRALASAGLGGTEFASADEVTNAIAQQNKPAANNGASNGVLKVRNQNILTEENSANTPTDWNNGRESAINFGKHKGKKWKEVPRDYLIWLAEGSDNEQWKAMANAEILLRVTEGAEKSKESNKETEKNADVSAGWVVEEKQESMALATEDDGDLPF